MTLGEKLKKLRYENALSGADVCEKLEINRTSLYKWEHDLVLPQPRHLQKLAKLYKVNVKEFTKGE